MSRPTASHLCYFTPFSRWLMWLAVSSVSLVSTNWTTAQDWPHALGPQYNGVASSSLPASWDIDAITQHWSLDAGEGFAGAVADGGVAYLWDRHGKSLRMRAVDLSSGEVRWTTEVPGEYNGGFDPDRGPRATPAISEGKIFAWSAGGLMFCFGANDGKVLWKQNLAETYPGDEGYFGHGSGPLVMGQTVLINHGSRKASIVGLDTMTGKVQWTSGTDQASYAAPIAAKIGERAVALVITRLNFLVVDPKTGEVLGATPFGKRGATVNAASPVLLEDSKAFLNAAYGIGAKVIQLPSSTNAAQDELKTVWESQEAFASQFTTPVLCDGLLYGTSGREDFNDGQLRCVDPTTGKILWNEPNWPLAHVILCSGRLLLLTLDSRLVEVKPSGEKLEVVGEKKLADKKTRPLPAVADGYFVFRTIGSSDSEKPQWLCYRLAVTED